jgi:hydrogenase maturation protein HypF
MEKLIGVRIHINGIVQGVGFRPFIYSLASRYAVKGWIRNTSAGVDIEADVIHEFLDEFIEAIKSEAPPLSQIDELSIEQIDPNGYTNFEIVHSKPIPGAFQPISPDVCICPDCLREMFTSQDRRYRYPFINCTNCGPRFTIIKDIPYDRPNTTMSHYPLCEDCRNEYEDPLDRRFHAQPVACPLCGPHVWLEFTQKTNNDESSIQEDHAFQNDAAILETQRLLKEGKIIAIKGIGGFHLACDATNSNAVAKLRNRKLRVDKPFALMMPSIEMIKTYCRVSEDEEFLLESRERPIIILQRLPASNISLDVSPGNNDLGVMLPYTPLHYLLFSQVEQNDHPIALVMTSGNLSEEPIATDNEEAIMRLTSLADAFLMHNRPIRTRCDDSVIRVITKDPLNSSKEKLPPNEKILETQKSIYQLRRSRGYSPTPILMSFDMSEILAVGPELKNTFCLTRDRYAILSHHIGDMENFETLQSFEDGIDHFKRLFHIHPQFIAHDLHPNYLSTRYALNVGERENLQLIGVQHHHAHIASCIAENGIYGDRPVIGVSFDGTGYGDDGAIWGGEFLLVDKNGYERAAHLSYMPLPGGDAAIRKPYRTALAYLWNNDIIWDSNLQPVLASCHDELLSIRGMLENSINTPQTSSMGRLFDAVAAISGVRQEVNYEAQAAIEFEMLADPNESGYYPFEISPSGESDLIQIEIKALLESLILDINKDVPVPIISARFHNAVAQMVLDVVVTIRNNTSLNDVALSGGVWQNNTLLHKTIDLLVKHQFSVFIHNRVPANDGGISLGQAVIANYQLN